MTRGSVTVAVLDGDPGRDHVTQEQCWNATCADVVPGTPAEHGDRHAVTTFETIRSEAPGARLLSIVVTPDDEVARLARALAWISGRGVDVVCIPLGLVAANVVLASSLAELRAQGVLVVAAVGNGGDGRACQPALDPNVLAVGSCARDGTPLAFSGSSVPAGSAALKPDVLASSPMGSAESVGTSVSCAVVAGQVAALLARHRSATAVEVGQALMDTAAPMDPRLRHRSRRGQIDVAAAERAVAADHITPPEVAPLPTTDGDPYVDPRLRWHTTAGPPDDVVHAVVLRDGTEVLSLRRAELERLFADPGLVAASAPDLAAWTLTTTGPFAADRLGDPQLPSVICIQRMSSGTRGGASRPARSIENRASTPGRIRSTP